MKKLCRIALVLALVFILSVMLVACGTSANLKKIFSDVESQNTFTTSEKIDFGTDGSYSSVSSYFNTDGIIIVSKPDSKKCFYDTVSKTLNSTLYNSISPLGHGIMVVSLEVDGDTKYGVINKSGAVLVGITYEHGKITFPSSNKGFLNVDGSFYKIKEGGVLQLVVDGKSASAFDVPTVVNTVIAVTDNYFYFIDTGNAFVAYEIETGIITFQRQISTANQLKDYYYVLSGDRIAIQTLSLLPTDSKNYDYYSGPLSGAKYNLSTQIVNPAKGTIKTVKFNYVINSSINMYDVPQLTDMFTKAYKESTIMIVTPIINQTAISNANNDTLLLVNNGLVIKGELKNATDGLRIDADRFIVSSNYGHSIIVSGNQKVIASISESYDFQAIAGKTILAFNNTTSKYGTFDTDGKIVISFDYQSSSDMLGHHAILTKTVDAETKYYSLDLDANSVSEIAVSTGSTFDYDDDTGLYCITTGSSRNYHSYSGKLILTVDGVFHDRATMRDFHGNITLLVGNVGSDYYLVK